MKEKIFLVITMIISSGINIAIPYSIARLNYYKIGDLGGYFYIWFSFFGGLILCLVLKKIIPNLHILLLKYILIIVCVFLISLIIHWKIFNSGGYGGWYYIPSKINFTTLNNEELYKFVFDKNEAIRDESLKELERRGPEINNLLIDIVNEQKLRFPDKYFDTYLVERIVETLSKRKVDAVVPILQDMLNSQITNIINYNSEKYKIKRYPNRINASKNLERYFNIKVTNIVTEERLNE